MTGRRAAQLCGWRFGVGIDHRGRDQPQARHFAGRSPPPPGCLIGTGDAQANAAAAWQHAGRGRPASATDSPPRVGRSSSTYDDLASAAMRQLRGSAETTGAYTFARRRIDAILARRRASAGRGPMSSGQWFRPSGMGRFGPSRFRPSRFGPSRFRCRRGGRRACIAEALTRAGYATTDGSPRTDPWHPDLSAPLPRLACRRGISRALRSRTAAISELLGTHVQRLARS